MSEPIQVQALALRGASAGPDQPGAVDPFRQAAQEFEAVFLAQVLAKLNPGLDGDDQSPFHDMFNDEVAKLISRSGGVGVADAVLKEMLKSQEVA
jgi:peptidoglycan hydrolase FlgJ